MFKKQKLISKLLLSWVCFSQIMNAHSMEGPIVGAEEHNTIGGCNVGSFSVVKRFCEALVRLNPDISAINRDDIAQSYDKEQRIILCKKNIQEIPTEISLLTDLKKLYLDQNQLTSLPDEINDLQLIILDLSANKFENFPLNRACKDEVGLSRSLTTLVFNDNQLKYLPLQQIKAFFCLKTLHLRRNKLSPSRDVNVKTLPQLEKFSLAGNPTLGNWSEDYCPSNFDPLQNILEDFKDFGIYDSDRKKYLILVNGIDLLPELKKVIFVFYWQL